MDKSFLKLVDQNGKVHNPFDEYPADYTSEEGKRFLRLATILSEVSEDVIAVCVADFMAITANNRNREAALAAAVMRGIARKGLRCGYRSYGMETPKNPADFSSMAVWFSKLVASPLWQSMLAEQDSNDNKFIRYAMTRLVSNLKELHQIVYVDKCREFDLDGPLKVLSKTDVSSGMDELCAAYGDFVNKILGENMNWNNVIACLHYCAEHPDEQE